MNKIDRANLNLLVKLAEQLLNAGDTGSGIRNIDVLEATLADIGSALNGKAPFELQALTVREEAHKASKCKCPETFHYNGCDFLIAKFEARTADGHPITDGMAVWDYDLKPGVLSLSRLGEDGWFEVRAPGASRGKAMNAERVCVRHPYNHKLASDAIKENLS